MLPSYSIPYTARSFRHTVNSKQLQILHFTSLLSHIIIRVSFNKIQASQSSLVGLTANSSTSNLLAHVLLCQHYKTTLKNVHMQQVHSWMSMTFRPAFCSQPFQIESKNSMCSPQLISTTVQSLIIAADFIMRCKMDKLSRLKGKVRERERNMPFHIS